MSGEARSVVVRLSLDTAQALRDSKEFGSEFGRAMDQAEKSTGRASGSVQRLEANTGKLALAAAAGFTAIAVTTANFDEAMSHVAATGDDARGSIEQLREAAIQAGQDTAFSATEAAGGIENLAKAGVSANDILGGGLAGSLDLAAAGGLDVASAAEIAATALTQFKLSGEDVPHVADLLAAAAGKAQGDVSDMSMALKQSGLVASQMGLSLEETTGTLAAFASSGLLGSDAGTSFRTMLLRLANPTKESAALMAQLGIQAYDAQGNFVGMASVSGQLKAALEDKTQAERDSALATIFGSDAIRAASVLYTEGSSGITDWTGKVNDAGYAAETAATRMDNLKGDVEQFTGSLETALIGAGNGAQGPLRDLVQGATDVVNVFNKAPAPIQGTVTALLGITAVTAGSAWFGAKVIGGIRDTKSALDDLGVSSDRVGRSLKVMGGITAAATVLIALEQAAAQVVRSTDKAAPSIEALTADLIDLNAQTGLTQGVADGLGDLHSSIDLLSDPGLAQSIGDVYDKVPLVGSAFADIAPVLSTTRQEAREAQVSITALDEALSNAVAKGSPEQAAAMFDQLAAAYHLSGDEQSALMDLLPGYQEALAGVANSAELTAGATSDMGVAGRQAAVTSEAALDRLQKTYEETSDAARETAREFIDLGDSLDNPKKSLGEWLHELEQQAEALRNFRRNAEQAADKGLRQGLIDALNEAGPAGALRMKQLANATDSEIRRANRAWQSGQREIGAYIKAQAGIPPKKVTTAEFKSFDAMTAIERLKVALSNIRDEDVNVRIHYLNIGNKLAGMAAVGAAGADGMTVPGPRAPYGDKVLSFIAPGEEVVSNRFGQADRHRSLLKAINANRYADGGTAGPYASVGAGGTPHWPDLAGPTGTAAQALGDLARASRKELEARQRLLEKEVERDQKAADAAKQHRDAVLDDMRAVRDSIAQRFQSDPFARRDGATIQTPDGIDSAAQSLAWEMAQQQVNRDLQQSPVEILRASIEQQELFQQLFNQLGRGRNGLHGAALTYAEQNADAGQLQALLDDPQMRREYQRLFGEERSGARALGQSAAFQRYGSELARMNRKYDQALAEARESKMELREMKKSLHHLERLAEKNPEETGEHVGNKLNRVAAAAGRRR